MCIVMRIFYVWRPFTCGGEGKGERMMTRRPVACHPPQLRSCWPEASTAKLPWPFYFNRPLKFGRSYTTPPAAVAVVEAGMPSRTKHVPCLMGFGQLNRAFPSTRTTYPRTRGGKILNEQRW